MAHGLDMTIHVRAYDHGRAEPFPAISARLWKLCGALEAIDPELGGWRGRVAEAVAAIDSERACDGLVASSARMWRSGERELVAYGPVATTSHQRRTTARLALVAGVSPSELPVWIPNQVELELRGTLAAALLADRPRLEAVFRAVVASSAPAWAVVSVGGAPSPPVPPFADGTPSVGWITYLASSYPQLPRTLKSPAVVHDLGTGIAIVAHPSKPDAQAIAQVQRALAEADVLVPAASLAPPAAEKRRA